MNRTTFILKTWLPVIIWICCIFLLSTETFSAEKTSRFIERILRSFQPNISLREIDTIHFFVRKAAHMAEYCIMSLLLFHSFRNTTKLQRHWRWVVYSLIIIIFIAVTDEYHQEFIASRTSSIIDVGIDIAGGVLGQLLCLAFFRLRLTRKKISDNN